MIADLAIPSGVPVHVSAFVPTWREPTLDELTYWQVLGHRRREPRPKRTRAFYMLGGAVHVSPENFDILRAGIEKTDAARDGGR